MEKNLNELSVEVEMLRDGVEARDEALSFMREEVDRSIDLLTNAAENREVLDFPCFTLFLYFCSLLK